MVAAALLGIGLAASQAGPATADPASLPTNATQAMQRLSDLARQSEQTNQATLAAQGDLDAKLAAQRDADAKRDADQRALDAAHATMAQYQPTIDRVAVASYEGARTSRLFSILLSDSPQQLIDQMSTMDVISAETAAQVAKYKQAAAEAANAEAASRQSAVAAKTAADQAAAVRGDLQNKQRDLQGQIAQVTQAWAALSSGEKSMWAGAAFPPGFDKDAVLKSLTPGSPIAALAAGLTRVGDPYVWGATGPGQFDCSGLVQWAFKQVGKNLPRTSEAQAQAGMPVDRNDLQIGDVVTFYSDASHVGIYAGNGMVLHAPTFGEPVKVAPMAGMPFHNARRY